MRQDRRTPQGWTTLAAGRAQVVVVQNAERSPGPVENSHTTSTPPSTTSPRQTRSAPRDKASLAMSYPAATRSHIAATSADRLAKMALDSLRFRHRNSLSPLTDSSASRGAPQ